MLKILTLVIFVLYCGNTVPLKQKIEQPLKSKTIIFIHGMFMTPASWIKWEEYFKSKGYKTFAPAWPIGHTGSASELRKKHPDKELGKLDLETVAKHYETIIKEQKEKPILIGHSMGGLVVQLLMQKNLAEAGIAVNSAPPKGIISLKWSFLKSNWAVISPFANKEEPYLMDQEAFNYAFVHTLPETEQKAVYESNVVPESRLVGNGPDSEQGKVDFTKKKEPLLFIAGAEDRIIPSSLNEQNFKAYTINSSPTTFKEFPSRTHYIIGQKGYEEITDFILNWLNGK
jgi:pimeloyl-ACP methyl ester carboxylesterase